MLGSYERGPVQPIPIPDLGPTITYERRKYIVNNYFRPVRLLSAGTWLSDGAFAPHQFDLHLSNISTDLGRLGFFAFRLHLA